MNYSDVLNNARQCIGKYCKACPVCNGVACKNQVPGPGAKGVGDTAIRNYNKWADIRGNMDTLCPGGTPDTTLELFGTEYPDGSHPPFHIYSMRQAIEEGFILDVLQNYMTYSTCFKIAKTIPDNPDLPASRAAKLLRK